ncbi:MAG TPA: hypothetical protein VHQ65_07730 [Thermoanaerobaculia bacterium]|nr:hypothetical protein [Thermoanaerobaculia bacterium]
MSDQTKHTYVDRWGRQPLPRSWEDQAFLREVAVAFLPPNHATAARQLSDFLFETILEFGAGCTLPAMLRALAADLKSTRDALAGITSDEQHPSSLTSWCDRLQAVQDELLAEAVRVEQATKEPEPRSRDEARERHTAAVRPVMLTVADELQKSRRALAAVTSPAMDLLGLASDLRVVESKLRGWAQRMDTPWLAEPEAGSEQEPGS